MNTKINRIRTRNKQDEDNFVKRNPNPYELLKEFLLNRRKYIKTNYPENQKIVLFELDLYLETLERVKHKL